MRHLLKSGDWLNHSRLVGWSAVLLVMEVLTFLFCVAGTHGLIVKLDHPTTSDFVSFYAAGVLANSDNPALVYSQPDHYAAEQAATEPGIEYNFFFYPPVFLLLCSLIARLPYMLALIVFEAGSCLLYIIVAGEILRERGWTWTIPLLAFPSVLWTVGLGQNAFLTAGLFGAATLLLERQPVVAGAVISLLCYKPHFALLIPLALASGRYWKAFVSAALFTALLVGLTGAIFGWDTWLAFIAVFHGAGGVFAAGRIPFAGLVSIFAAARMLGLSVDLAYFVQGAFALAAAVVVAMIWRRSRSPAVRFAALIAGTLLAIPVVLFYDLLLLTIAACWLVRVGRGGGFLAWEKTGLAAMYLVPLLSRSLGLAVGLPIGPLAALGMLRFCAARAWRTIPQLSRKRDDIEIQPAASHF